MLFETTAASSFVAKFECSQRCPEFQNVSHNIQLLPRLLISLYLPSVHVLIILVILSSYVSPRCYIQHKT
jgi:hypothetical protein